MEVVGVDASGQSCLLCKRDRLKRLLREGGGGSMITSLQAGGRKQEKLKAHILFYYCKAVVRGLQGKHLYSRSPSRKGETRFVETPKKRRNLISNASLEMDNPRKSKT